MLLFFKRLPSYPRPSPLVLYKCRAMGSCPAFYCSLSCTRPNSRLYMAASTGSSSYAHQSGRNNRQMGRGGCRIVTQYWYCLPLTLLQVFFPPYKPHVRVLIGLLVRASSVGRSVRHNLLNGREVTLSENLLGYDLTKRMYDEGNLFNPKWTLFDLIKRTYMKA